MCVLKTLFLLVSFILSSPPAWSTIYDWSPLSNEDVQFTEDPQVEAEFRTRAIGEARQTIRLISFDLRTRDKTGIQLLDALRAAANRGIEVQVIRGGLVSKFFAEYHPLRDRVQEYLMNPPTLRPIQYQLVGNSTMLRKGWSPLLGTHEKLLVMDGKTLIMTGRGFADSYQSWLDTCFIFKGVLVAQGEATFASIWHTIHQEAGTIESRESRRTQSAPMEKTVTPDLGLATGVAPALSDSSLEVSAVPSRTPVASTDLNSAQLIQVENFMRWLDEPSSPLPDGSAPPMRARFLHHNLVEQVRKRCWGIPYVYSYMPCFRIDDPITHAMVQRISEAEVIQLTTLATIFPPPIKKALLDRLKERTQPGGRPFSVQILTNTRQSHRVILSYPMPWHAGLSDLQTLLQAGAEVYGLSPAASHPYQYLHRKLFLASLPGGQKVAIIGSHNATRASLDTNDEASAEIEGLLTSPFLESLSRIFEESIARTGVCFQCDQVQRENRWSTFPGWGWRGFGWSWATRLAEGLI